ncbi:MAG: hypothetical protein ACTSPW_19485, partial [Promethearchaeota archaeon]
MSKYFKPSHREGLSVEEYIRLYDMSKEEVLQMIKLSSYALKLDEKRFNVERNLGMPNSSEYKYTIKDEQIFQDKIVIPQLKKRGHKIKNPLSVSSKYLFHPIIDILSTFKNRNYFT